VRAAFALAAGLLALDCVLIVAYWLLRGELMASRSPAGGYPLEPLDFESPASLPSLLQYAQLLGAVALFIWAYRAKRTRARLAAAAIVGLILLDAALELHEAFGRRLRCRLGPARPARPAAARCRRPDLRGRARRGDPGRSALGAAPRFRG